MAQQAVGGVRGADGMCRSLYIKLARSLDGAKHDGAMGLDKGKIEQHIHEIDNLRLQLVRVTTEVSFCKIRTCCECLSAPRSQIPLSSTRRVPR